MKGDSHPRACCGLKHEKTDETGQKGHASPDQGGHSATWWMGKELPVCQVLG